MAATRWSASTAGVAAAADEAYDVACHVAGASWAGPGEAAAGRACTGLPVRVSAWCVCAGRSGRRLASCGRCGGRLPSVADPTVGWREVARAAGGTSRVASGRPPGSVKMVSILLRIVSACSPICNLIIERKVRPLRSRSDCSATSFCAEYPLGNGVIDARYAEASAQKGCVHLFYIFL